MIKTTKYIKSIKLVYKYFFVVLLLILMFSITESYASLFFINTKDEVQEGYKQYEMFDTIDDQQKLSRIQTIGDRLSIYSKKRNGIDYIFSLITEENAFSGFAGFIYVGEPVYNLAGSNDELAFIIAHEMAHSDNRDTADSIEQIYAEKYKDKEETKISISDEMLKGYFFNRIQEYRADSQAVLYLYVAGYDPEAGIRVMDKFQKRYGAYPPGTEKVAGHPSYTSRKRNLEAFIKEMKYVENFYYKDGEKYLNQKKYDDAIKTFTEYLGFFYNSSGGYEKRGYAYYLKAVGNNSNSKYIWADGRNSKEIKTNSNNGLDKINLNKALKDFKKASTIDTNNPEIYNFIGLIAAQLGQNDGAANYLNIAIGLNSNNCSAINNLAVLYALQSKFDEANKLFKNAKTNCPDSKEMDLNMKQIGKN